MLAGNTTSPFITRLLPILTIVFLFGANPVSAEETHYSSGDTILVVGQRNETIPTMNDIATKLLIPLRLTPVSVGIVTEELNRAQCNTTLGDAMKNVGGVNCQTGSGTHDVFIMRGFGSLENGLILTDGAADPKVTSYNLYNLEQIEVLKGPGAFLYGGSPLSGTINLSTKKPLFDNFFNITGSAGRFQTRRSTIDMGATNPDQTLAVRVNGMYQQSDNYRDEKKYDASAINPVVSWRLGARSQARLSFEYVNNNYQPDYGLPLIFDMATQSLTRAPDDIPKTNSYQVPFDDSDQKIIRIKADWQTKINPSLVIRNKFYYTDLDWEAKGTLLLGARPIFYGEDPYGVIRSLTILDDRQKLVGNQLEALWFVDTGPLRHHLIIGLEASQLTDKYQMDVAQLPPINLYDPIEYATEESLLIFPYLTADATSQVIAGYTVDRITFSEKFQAFLGGRYDMIDYEETLVKTERDYQKFSPLAGAVFAPTEELSFYGSFGNAFAPPSTRVIGEREAEKSEQVEIGVKSRLWQGRLRATLALYQLEKDHIAIPNETGVINEIGNQKSKGAELEITVEAASDWIVWASYSYVDAELTEFWERPQVGVDENQQPIYQSMNRSGNRPAFTPENLFNIWTTKEFSNGFGAGVGARYYSSQFIASDNAFKIDGAFILDASLSYQIGNFRWSVNGKNLTDKSYYTRGFGSSSVIPAHPIAVYVGMEFSL
ncbi:MAG: hypothetical protein B6244_00530 [Candidatus Cloacimonetes bacterium 4572_55]|nr:MAG: hypothetical protein B6244_00530 [Candidatus Cloacimonetes bacterium 4572_55]